MTPNPKGSSTSLYSRGLAGKVAFDTHFVRVVERREGSTSRMHLLYLLHELGPPPGYIQFHQSTSRSSFGPSIPRACRGS